MKTIITYLFIIACSTLSFGQKVNEVLQKMSEKITAPNVFCFDTKYSLYKDQKTNVAKQTYLGFFIKNQNNEIYYKIDNTEFINTKKMGLKINHKQKAMSITNSQDFSTGSFDISKLMAFCTISSFIDNKTFWEIILTPKELSGLNYSQIVLNIGTNYLLQKQVFYYNTGFNLSNDYKKQLLDYPKLEIIYSGYNNKVNEVNKINTSLYFKINQNNKIQATEKYKNYEVVDTRTNLINKNKAAN